jgi:hypothetical protein
LKEDAPLNVLAKFITLEVSHPFISLLKVVLSWKILSREVTPEMSQSFMQAQDGTVQSESQEFTAELRAACVEYAIGELHVSDKRRVEDEYVIRKERREGRILIFIIPCFAKIF